MKRSALNASACISTRRRLASGNVAQLSTVVLKKKLPVPAKTSLAEKLRKKTSTPASESPAKATTATAAPFIWSNALIGSGTWKPEEWKDDWGSDALAPKGSKPLPPHLKHTAAKEPMHAFPQAGGKQKANVASPTSRKIEGLLDPLNEPVLQDLPPTSQQHPIATLEHGLERVLFNPGVHWLQDPRSRVYNFPPHLENIPKVTEFAFERLPGFIKSSRDKDLRSLAARENRKFAGSTSSLTGMLGHCYFLLSEHKPVDISSLSQHFQGEDKNFTPGQRMPTSVLFSYKNGVYAIDSDGDDASKNVLTWLGTLLEKFLTMSKAEFGTYLRSSPSLEEEEDPIREAYRYAKSKKFVMRSQLDGVDRRLPGTGVFDIKTRACLPIRLDILNWEENSGYVIKFAQGLVESFEREYFDLIRSAFLKYGFQVRIGNMDGVIVAYHNTSRLFGFQYISLDEMDQRLFGPEPGVGDRVFEKCVGLLECIAPEIVQCFPNKSVKCTFECEEGSKELNVWVQPADWSPIRAETEPPMRQLVVRVQNFLSEAPVSGHRAINASSTMPWTLYWSVAHLAASQEEIRMNFEKCMARKFRAWSLPTGVSFEDLPQFWSDLNFGAPKTAEEVKAALQLPDGFDYTKFRTPNERVQILRDLARSGREFTEERERLEQGRKKIVLGEPFDISDLEIEKFEAEDDLGAVNDEVQSEVEAAAVSEDQIQTSAPSTLELDDDALTSMADEPNSSLDTMSSSPPPSAKEDQLIVAEIIENEALDFDSTPVDAEGSLHTTTTSIQESSQLDGLTDTAMDSATLDVEDSLHATPSPQESSHLDGLTETALDSATPADAEDFLHTTPSPQEPSHPGGLTEPASDSNAS
ncbi:mitochondrial protein Pet127-domain-containing protein [Mycena alexandri]|uniref:Mitochondrial protein Pet127-domain-containing protein n=1 Tax=Mycena alexandri TaxID=1745969 RepID=A0AAD6TE70_9AGAR|nr:mitochondrial protein Pet127-domain-containing protein [Mycena alexandri]